MFVAYWFVRMSHKKSQFKSPGANVQVNGQILFIMQSKKVLSETDLKGQ